MHLFQITEYEIENKSLVFYRECFLQLLAFYLDVCADAIDVDCQLVAF